MSPYETNEDKAEIYEKAAEYLSDPKHFIQGAIGRDTYEEPKFCILGAVNYADTGDRNAFDYPDDDLVEPLYDVIVEERWNKPNNNSSLKDTVTSFNDDTQDPKVRARVIYVLREAARRLRSS